MKRRRGKSRGASDPYKASVEGLRQQTSEVCLILNLPPPERELRFWPGRKFQFDAAIPSLRVALEYEGGVFTDVKGRHMQAGGFMRDMEKYNEAAVRGWLLLRFGPKETASGSAKETIYRAFEAAIQRSHQP